MGVGAGQWKAGMDASNSVPELISTRAYLLGQSALDRALTGDCGAAKKLAEEMIDLPHGPTAWFHAGMAEGLCGDPVRAEEAVTGCRRSYPHRSAGEQNFVSPLP